MAKYAYIEQIIEIPSNVQVSVSKDKKVLVEGPKGKLERDFSHARSINIEKENNELKIFAHFPRKKERALLGTIKGHIGNMIKGVTEGFIYKMKIVYAHFPITVEIDDKSGWVYLQNFLGERGFIKGKDARFARKAKIVGDTIVRVEKDDVILSGINIEEVAQTTANIQKACRIKNKDPRVFMDGVYVYEKIK